MQQAWQGWERKNFPSGMHSWNPFTKFMVPGEGFSVLLSLCMTEVCKKTWWATKAQFIVCLLLGDKPCFKLVFHGWMIRWAKAREPLVLGTRGTRGGTRGQNPQLFYEGRGGLYSKKNYFFVGTFFHELVPGIAFSRTWKGHHF